MIILFFILRLALGLPMPIEAPEVCAVAEVRLEQVQSNFSHEGFRGSTTLGGWWYENLARGYGKEEEVFMAWMQSAKHLEILTKPMTEVCFVEANNYYVMVGHKS